MKPPVITLLTDFGTSDYFVGAMKGVILGICPGAQIVDITHDITPFQIAQGAWTLAQTWQCFPPGTIHVAVVDPGVGSARLPILAEAGGHFFVAPDNGVLTQVFATASPGSVRIITAEQYFRHPVSHTFHGRDIFAPVAAHLAAGVPPNLFGEPAPGFATLALPVPVQLDDRTWQGQVLWTDRFGNLVTCFDAECFNWVTTHPFRLEIGRISIQKYAQYYGQIERETPSLVRGSAGLFEVSLNQQHAANKLGLAPGASALLIRI